MARSPFQTPPPRDRVFTDHARSRMSARSVSADQIDLVLAFGRVVHTRGAQIHVIGYREVSRFRRRGVDLSRCEGLHVVCSPDGAILTVYRNRDFSPLREKGRRCWH